jgi:hypothetical protein
MTDAEREQFAEAIRAECIRAALAAYEAARVDGLCDEGAFEVAIDAVRALRLGQVASRESREGTS